MTSLIAVDSNIVIKAMRRRDPVLETNLGHALDQGNGLALSVVTETELLLGVKRHTNYVHAASRLEQFMKLITTVWEFDSHDAEVAAEIRCDLMQRGQIIGAYDNLIAAQAVRRGVLLVTNNTREFERVKGLRCVDWTI